MSGEVLQLYVSEQLHKFRFGQRCCMKLLGFLFSLERQHFLKSANDLNLHMRTYVYDGQEIVIVFKDSCHHVVTDPCSLNLHPDSLKELYALHCGIDFNGHHKEAIGSSSVELGSRTAPPSVPPHRFSLGPLKQSIARSNPFIKQSDQYSYFDAYKEIILSSLATHRVLIINGGPRCNMSTIIPLYIINKCAGEKIHCKIICVEREQLVAIYNSELVADLFQEKIGVTVAYQIQLQSRISDSSNLVYTTSFFLLRVLMGQSVVDSFRHISHIIVVDVHLHEVYADLLLRELKEALKYHPQLKVILLSSSSKNYEFLNYFGEGKELFIPNTGSSIMLNKPRVLYLDDICKNLSDNRISNYFTKTFCALPVRSMGKNNNRKHLDKCLGCYERFGSDHCFETLLYMFTSECCDINYRHSITGRTAIIIASMLGNFSHVQTLIQLNANPRINDYQGLNALTTALAMGHKDCVEILQISQCEQSIMPLRDSNKDYIDYYLIIDIIQMINTNTSWKPGNVIVFLPSYQHLVKLNYITLKQKILGNISEKLMVFLLHNQIEKSDLDIIIQRSSGFMKLILATEVAESLTCFDDIQYVIDTVRNYRLIYNYQNMCKEYVYEWSPKCSVENRTMIKSRKTEDIICFRLITKSKYDQLSELPTPEMLYMYLDRVCLSVKLLSPNNMVSEYLQDTIVKPPFLHVHRTVEHLKKINVFTELEDMTWLGCRLIDVPVECYLGKILVFAILLQCLDPILTIVGFMSTVDPYELCHYVNELTGPYRNMICYKIKEEKERLSEGILSDHLVYLRLYQEWQNDFRDEGNSPELNEYHFTLSGLLEQVCNVRTQLVGSLRSSQLIHSKGNLSMHYINLKSNSWPVIKAALVGGMYPNICIADFKVNRIKSPCRRELVLHPHSVLRSIELDSMSSLNFNSPWIIYGKEKNGYNCNSVECNTVVTPITIALFAGPTKLSSSNLQIIANQQESPTHFSFLHVDDWITFTVDYKEAQLLLKTRQNFFSIYENYLQNCGFLESHKRPHIVLSHNAKLFDCIEKLLIQEDIISGFTQPEKIGLRPKALPNQFMMRHNAFMLITSHCYKTSKNKQLLKQFFMICCNQELSDGNNNGSNTSTNSVCCNNEWYHVLKELIPPKPAENKLTFVISYSLNPDYLRSVYVAEWYNGVLKLHLCFKSDINFYDILNQMPVKGLFSLAVNGKRAAFQLDNATGEFLVNLFAAHNSWIHA